MTNIDRRYVLATLAVGAAVGATSAKAAPKELSLAQMKKDAEVACLYHCDFGDDRRYGDMLRNINNHLSVYDFDPLATKIIIVAHSVGIKYHLKAHSFGPSSQESARQKISDASGPSDRRTAAHLRRMS